MSNAEYNEEASREYIDGLEGELGEANKRVRELTKDITTLEAENVTLATNVLVRSALIMRLMSEMDLIFSDLDKIAVESSTKVLLDFIRNSSFKTSETLRERTKQLIAEVISDVKDSGYSSDYLLIRLATCDFNTATLAIALAESDLKKESLKKEGQFQENQEKQ